MPYTDPFVYLRINGKFTSATTPQEQWSVGMKLLQPTGTPSAATLLSFLQTVEAPIKTFHAAAVNAGSETYITDLTAAVVGEDGKYVGGGAQITTKHTLSTPHPGGGTPRHPYAQATVLSLRTAIARGRASNGRIYWPAQAVTIDSATGSINSASTDLVASQAGTMLSQINAAADTIIVDNLGIWVMSNLDAGTSSPVINVRVGSKPDHMETRERQLVEAYSLAPVTALPLGLADIRDLPVGTPWEGNR